MKKIITLFLLISHIIIYAKKDVLISSTPLWVNPTVLDTSNIPPDHGGYIYLLEDIQDNLSLDEFYNRQSIKVFNSEGIDLKSDIQIDFDPSYETLVFHEVYILRGGKKISQLAKKRIQTFRRETNLEKSLYDGNLYAVINLTDVRKNDIINYSYSIKGRNSLLKNDFTKYYYQEVGDHVQQFNHRILIPKEQELFYQCFNDAISPRIKTVNQLTEYSWNIKNVESYFFDTNTPYWYDGRKHVLVSTFRTWNDLVNWYEKMYRLTNPNIETLLNQLNLKGTKEEQIIKTIRFVQDEIRYLGFEAGIHGHVPHQPHEVITQKYGDCKDKAFLLSTLLNGLGIESYPFLVNTSYGITLDSIIPSDYAFNHCITKFSYENHDYFVDATMRFQGGDLKSMSIPRYFWGLKVKNDETSLTQIIAEDLDSIKVNKEIRANSFTGDTYLNVETIYSGNKSNQIRAYFKSNSQKSIRKSYTNFYSNLYPKIELVENIQITSDSRLDSNRVIVSEKYIIKDFWTLDGNKYISKIEPQVLSSYLNYSSSKERTMPYHLGRPIVITQETHCYFPEKWSIKENHTVIDNELFYYETKEESISNEVHLTYKYTRKKNYLEPNQVNDFLNSHENILDKIVFTPHYYLDNIPEKTTTPIHKNNYVGSFFLIIGAVGVLISLFKYFK